MRGMNGVPAGAVSSGRTSIHPDTQGLHYTLMGKDGKPIEGIWGQGGKQCMGAGNHTDRQSAMMKRLPSLFLLSDPACPPPASPSSPTALYCNALPADRPDTCHTASHSPSCRFFLPGLSVSPSSMYPFTSSHGELKQRWISLEGDRWETCLNWGGM